MKYLTKPVMQKMATKEEIHKGLRDAVNSFDVDRLVGVSLKVDRTISRLLAVPQFYIVGNYVPAKNSMDVARTSLQTADCSNDLYEGNPDLAVEAIASLRRVYGDLASQLNQDRDFKSRVGYVTPLSFLNKNL